jgi:hypothetical protein
VLRYRSASKNSRWRQSAGADSGNRQPAKARLPLLKHPFFPSCLAPGPAGKSRAVANARKRDPRFQSPANHCHSEPVPYMHKNFAIQILQHPNMITIIYDPQHENRSSADEQVSSGGVRLPIPIRAHLFKGSSASIRDADALNQGRSAASRHRLGHSYVQSSSTEKPHAMSSCSIRPRGVPASFLRARRCSRLKRNIKDVAGFVSGVRRM